MTDWRWAGTLSGTATMRVWYVVGAVGARRLSPRQTVQQLYRGVLAPPGKSPQDYHRWKGRTIANDEPEGCWGKAEELGGALQPSEEQIEKTTILPALIALVIALSESTPMTNAPQVAAACRWMVALGLVRRRSCSGGYVPAVCTGMTELLEESIMGRPDGRTRACVAAVARTVERDISRRDRRRPGLAEIGGAPEQAPDRRQGRVVHDGVRRGEQ